ncbi:hypothetical protein GUJ93_ZPchr0009g939 [Zizania palustris]|uniref:Coilin tudor domain-containing protein n=1 Tax=Zizania palustris TaxID=103762 RepID=A0A8J5UXG9_ZIZPA|nr:hypothetical protein GUJ93_ZPchr0009g939 [Zizania palustris]
MDNSNKKSSDTSYYGSINGSDTEVNHHVIGNKTNENGFSAEKIGESSHVRSANENTVAGERKSSSEHLNFESLYPLTRLPKEGDLIVYRLVELSSLWCPELSSHRVGKVLIYDPISLRIILLPVPEYPIIFEETNGEDEPDMLVGMSPYKEDGALEIEYSSLLDVRLLKDTESLQPAVSAPLTETCKKSGSLIRKQVSFDNDKVKTHSQMVRNNTKGPEDIPEKTPNKLWEESGDASNEEPAVQDNGWGAWTRNASISAWSYRALRSSALGPTVALLRGKTTKGGKPCNRKYGK